MVGTLEKLTFRVIKNQSSNSQHYPNLFQTFSNFRREKVPLKALKLTPKAIIIASNMQLQARCILNKKS